MEAMRRRNGHGGSRSILAMAAFVAGILSISFAATLFVVSLLESSGSIKPDTAQAFLWVPIGIPLVSLLGMLFGARVLADKRCAGRGFASAGIVLSLLGVLGMIAFFIPF